jgi:ribosomal protein S18 acetylase RimI-like enzyme
MFQGTANPLSSRLSFRAASEGDEEFIAALINSAYRGDSSRAGWTTEADLLEGTRTNPNEVLGLIQARDSTMLLCQQADQIVGCVYLQKRDEAGYLGMFVVSPKLQGSGIGKQFMAAAEDHVQRQWGVRRMIMSVITLREELIAYYERRGYRRTGKFEPFPTDLEDTITLVDNLQFETLEKHFQARRT